MEATGNLERARSASAAATRHDGVGSEHSGRRVWARSAAAVSLTAGVALAAAATQAGAVPAYARLLVASIARSVPPAAALTSQTITFNALPNKTYGNPPFTITATASSGLPVSFASLTTAACTASGSTVTLVAAGTCTIRASQAGNAAYAPAPNVDRTFTVAKANQAITFGTLANRTVASPPFTVNATASSGLPVSFASLTTAVCTMSGNTVTIVAAGTCTIRASQAGNASYNAASPVSRSFGVTKLSQTITFAALGSRTYGDPPFTVSATASSGLPVTFASLTAAVCTVSGNTVTIAAAGTCTIQARQAGNTTYAAASGVNQSFTVAKASQTITFAPLTDRILGTAAFAVGASASSNLPVTFASLTTNVCTLSGSTVTLVATGSCTIQAKQVGNANYLAAASVSRSFAVKASQVITFGALSDKTVGAPPFAVSASASSGLAVGFASLTAAVCTVSGSTVTIAAGGTCTVRASQAGNATYAPAPDVDRSFAVAAAPPSGGVQFRYDGAGNLIGVQRN